MKNDFFYIFLCHLHEDKKKFDKFEKQKRIQKKKVFFLKFINIIN